MSLWPALFDGLVLDEGSSYHFLHDRVQQAVYSLIPDDQRAALHHEIGSLFLQAAEKNPAFMDEMLFDIVEQLNRGRALVHGGEACLKLAQLNMQAGTKARESGAWSEAGSFFEAGIGMLREGGLLASESGFAFQVRKQHAQCLYLSGKLEVADRLFQELLAEANTSMLKAEVWIMMIVLYANRSDFAGAIELGVQALAVMGVEFPRSEEAALPLFLAEAQRLKDVLGARTIPSLIATPLLEDPVKKMVLNLVMSLAEPCYVIALPLRCALAAAITARMSAEFGFNDVSALGFTFYAPNVMGAFKDPDTAFQYGQLALSLMDKYPDVKQKSRIPFMAGLFSVYLRRPINESVALMRRSIVECLEAGDPPYGCWAASNTVIYLFAGGETLDNVIAQGRTSAHYIKKLNYTAAFYYMMGAYMAASNLRGDTASQEVMDCDLIGEADLVRELKSIPTGQFVMHYGAGVVAFHYGDFAKSLASFAQCDLGAVQGMAFVPDMLTQAALAGLAFCDTSRGEERDAVMKLTMQRVEAVREWAKHCPQNFGHQASLLEAELAGRAGEHSHAAELYEAAIAVAAEHAFLNHEALACELAAKYFQRAGRSRFARVYMKDALHAYQSWGAHRKAAHLEERHSDLLGQSASVASTRQTVTGTLPQHTTTGRSAKALDLTAVVRAYGAISKEIVLDRLLAQVMKVLIEAAGAQSGCIVLDDKERGARVRVRAGVEANDLSLAPVDLEGADFLPVALVRSVIQTGESVVLASAADDAEYGSHPYVIKQPVLSVLCAPIVYHGRVNGAIYLENNLVRGAFTLDRLEVVSLLSTQAAISLENAALYSGLEEKVQARTAQLVAAQEQVVKLEKAATEMQMAGGFAHEMRNALFAARNWLGLCSGANRSDDGAQRASQHEALATLKTFFAGQPNLPAPIQQAVDILMAYEVDLAEGLEGLSEAFERALRITAQILEFAQVGHLQRVEQAPVALGEVVTTILEEMSRDFGKAGIKAAVNLVGSPAVEVDEDHLYSIIRNLVANARDALEEVQDSRDSLHIKVDASVADAKVIIRVEDNGGGMTDAVRGRVFQPFFTTKEVNRGTGLGLGYVKRLVEWYGGTVTFTTETNQGTAFRVALPVVSSRSNAQ